MNSELNLKNLPFAVIDGKQRLQAIFGFYENIFCLNEDFVLDSDTSLNLGGLRFSDLKKNYPDVASTFENFNLHVMSVITNDEAKINDLFVRLNRSKPLTGAEIRNAMKGAVPSNIREICEHKFFAKHIAFPKKRAQDKNTAAKLLLIEFRGNFVDTKKTHLDRFVREGLKSQGEDIVHTAKRVIKVLDDMVSIFTECDPLLVSQGLVPIYYWLARTFGPHRKIREFLVHFEKLRKDNRAKKSDDANKELLTYDVLNRSTNDQGSLVKRYQILETHFKQFTKSA